MTSLVLGLMGLLLFQCGSSAHSNESNTASIEKQYPGSPLKHIDFMDKICGMHNVTPSPLEEVVQHYQSQLNKYGYTQISPKLAKPSVLIFSHNFKDSATPAIFTMHFSNTRKSAPVHVFYKIAEDDSKDVCYSEWGAKQNYQAQNKKKRSFKLPSGWTPITFFSGKTTMLKLKDKPDSIRIESFRDQSEQILGKAVVIKNARLRSVAQHFKQNLSSDHIEIGPKETQNSILFFKRKEKAVQSNIMILHLLQSGKDVLIFTSFNDLAQS